MAKFSKAHYGIICSAMKKSIEEMDAESEFKHTSLFTGFRQNLIKVFSADNPKFDVQRFLRASQPEVKRS